MLVDFLAGVAPDKWLHFGASFLIALFDVSLAFIAGIGKEMYDIAIGGVSEAGDLVADWIGIYVATLFI